MHILKSLARASGLVCAIVAIAAPAFAETPSTIAIRNARIVTASGPVIEKGSILVRNGLIEAVGDNISIPPSAWTIEGEGLTVYPGLIDALSTWGVTDSGTSTPNRSATTAAAGAPAAPPATPRGPEDRPRTNSWVKAADQASPADRRIESARNAGFTTAVTFPRNGIFAGQGAVLNLGGNKAADMVVASGVGQYVSFQTGGGGGGGGAGFPGSLMGVIAYVRQIYVDAERYARVKKQYEENPRGLPRPEYDRALEGVLESPRVLLPATRAVEISRMVRFAEGIGQKAVLYGGHEAYRAAALLKQANIPAIIAAKWPERARDSDPDQTDSYRTLEVRERADSGPGELAKAGVLFAFSSDGMEAPADMLRNVRKSIAAGLSPQDAVKALTINPAQIYGVADRLGSVEKGKIANLLVVKGDLFAERPELKYIIIDGAKYEPTPESTPPAGAAPGGRRPSSNDRQDARIEDGGSK